MRCGVIANAYFNQPDGWYYVDGIIWDDKAQDLINKGWSVSCSYDYLAFNDEGGEENNIHYDKEFTQLNFTHLAIVDNPRYERANIVFNSKIKSTEVNNEDQWITIYPNGKDAKGKHLLLKDGESPKEAIERTYGKGEKSDTKDKESYDKAKGRAQKALDLAKKAVEGKELSQQEKDWLNSNKSADKLSKSKQSDSKDMQNPDDELVTVQKADTHKLEVRLNDLKSRYNEVMKYYWEADEDDRDIHQYKADAIQDEMISIQDRLDKLKSNKTDNSKEQDMAIIDELKKLIFKVENNKENETMVENEKVDKRKLIDEVAGIMKSAGCDDEDIRTAIGKMEKIGYDDSEASADNKKVKNEADEEDKKVDNEEDDKEEDKVDNESDEDKEKAEDLKEEEKKDVENKCKNSVGNAKGGEFFDKINKIYNSAKKIEEPFVEYESKQARLEAGKEYFG